MISTLFLPENEFRNPKSKMSFTSILSRRGACSREKIFLSRNTRPRAYHGFSLLLYSIYITAVGLLFCLAEKRAPHFSVCEQMNGKQQKFFFEKK